MIGFVSQKPKVNRSPQKTFQSLSVSKRTSELSNSSIKANEEEKSPTKPRELSRVPSGLTSSVLMQHGRKERFGILSASRKNLAASKTPSKDNLGVISKLKYLDS